MKLLYTSLSRIAIIFLLSIVSVFQIQAQKTSDQLQAARVGTKMVYPTDSLNMVSMYGVTYKKESIILKHNNVGAIPGLSTSSTVTLPLHDNPSALNCFCTCIKKTILRIEFDCNGDNPDFRHAGTTWESKINIIALSSAININLEINQQQPQQVFEQDITNLIDPSIRCYNGTNFNVDVQYAYITAPQADQQPDIRLRIRLINEMELQGSTCTNYQTTILPLTTSNPGNYLGNPLVLQWEVSHQGTGSCPDKDYVPNYQVQILKLFNTDPANANNENTIRATIDWKNALTFETYSPTPQVELTMAEGRGFYVWRVRPIGNKEEGGIANPKNLGAWNVNSFQDGTTLQIVRATTGQPTTSTGTPKLFDGLTSIHVIASNQSTEQTLADHNMIDVFFYEQFDNDKNWIFSRTFTEGSTEFGPQFNESINFANSLLQPIQHQVALQSRDNQDIDHIVTSFTGYDFAGRPVLQTLPAALPSRSLGYVKNIFTKSGSSNKLYSAFDFDNTVTNGTVQTAAANQANLHTSTGPTDPTVPSIGSYFSDNNSDISIPSAEGYPFSRTIYGPDPLGRVTEQSGLGEDFKIGSSKTVRTLYTGSPENELLSVFGDEAPKNSSTFKSITTDPNGVTSVAYTTSDGKTVATCLMKKDGYNSLQELDITTNIAESDKEYINTVTVIDSALGNRASGDTYFSATTFVLMKETQCQLNYDMVRKKVELDCPTLCKYCDYIVNVKLIKDSDNSILYQNDINLTDVECTANATSELEPEALTLSPGKYTLTRTIQSNTSITVNGVKKKRIDSYVDNLTSLLPTATTNLFANTTTGIFGSRILEHWNPVIPQGMEAEDYFTDLYEELLDHYVTFRNTRITSQNTDLLSMPNPFECYTVKLPQPDPTCESPCTTFIPNQEGTSPNYEQLLPAPENSPNFNRVSAYFKTMQFGVSGNAPKIIVSVLGDGSGNVTKNNLFGSSSLNGAFNTLVGNMIRYGYSCGKLWRCWQGAITALKNSNHQFELPPSKLPLNDKSNEGGQATFEMDGATGSVQNRDFNLFETFMDCAGRKFHGSTSDYSVYIGAPYRYVRRDATQDGDYETLYRECVLGLFGAYPGDLDEYVYPLACTETAAPNIIKQVEENLNMVWQCMKAKIQEGVFNYRKGIAGTLENKIAQKTTPDAGSFPPLCCVPTPTLTFPFYDPQTIGIDLNCCTKAIEDEFGGQCDKECEKEGQLARKSIMKDYEDSYHLIEGETYTINGTQILATEGMIVPTEPHTYQYLPRYYIDCAVASAIAYCKSECHLTIDFYKNGNNEPIYVKQVGTPEEILKRQKVFSHRMVTRPRIGNGPLCSQYNGDGVNYTYLNAPGRKVDEILSYLNNQLDVQYRKDVKADPGEWRDVYALIKYVQDKHHVKGYNNTYNVDWVCADPTILGQKSLFVFLDKAELGKGVNKFYSYIDPITNQCKIAFKHDKKIHQVDKGERSIKFLEAYFEREKNIGRWKDDYNIFVNNDLSMELNDHLISMWGSHQYLYKNSNGKKPNDSCSSPVEFFTGAMCDIFGSKNYIDPDSYHKFESWFYKWYFPSDPPSIFSKQTWVYANRVFDNIYHQNSPPFRGYTMEFNPWIDYYKDGTGWPYTRGLTTKFFTNSTIPTLSCLNGTDLPTPITGIISDLSTLDYAFRVKFPMTNMFGYDLEENELFGLFTYLGTLKIKIIDPYNPTNVRYIEIWMDKENCTPGNTPEESNFGTIFNLHLRFTDPNNLPAAYRTYPVTYPSETFDKLVFNGFTDPYGCKAALPSYYDRAFYLQVSLGNFIDVIGGFYINNEGYLTFHDSKAGTVPVGTTTDDYIFYNIKLDCYKDDCIKDNIDVFCADCDEPWSCVPLCIGWVPDFTPTGTPVKFRVKGCEEVEVNRLVQNIQSQINLQHKQAMAALRDTYYDQCVNPKNIEDAWTARYDQQFYHYTLYYYDRAGRLVKTVPPKGVHPLPKNTTNSSLPLYPRTATNHSFISTYRYNSLGQIVEQTTPDAGTTKFWYDGIGNLRLSQNAQQSIISPQRYSYSKYDHLNRVIEAGEAVYSPSQAIADNPEAPTSGLYEYTKIHYSDDQSASLPAPFTLSSSAVPPPFPERKQRFLLNRVSWTETYDLNFNSTKTYYSYDPHGNVEWLIQNVPGLGANVIDYDYDLISGKVNMVSYQDGFKDRFYHRYNYDQDNRITSVETSKDKKIWERDASYNYYAHGPLQRAVTGQDQVQGTDFTYTIQGWLKGINHPQVAAVSSNPSGSDPGKDGYGTDAPNSNVALDAYGTTLSYYTGDFKHTNSPFASGNTATNPTIDGKELFNGNIAGWVNGFRNETSAPQPPVAGIYKYDVLNRLREDDPRKLNGMGTNVSWGEVGYGSEYNYDPNGNLKTLLRADKDVNVFDDFTYTYPTGKNQLNHIHDVASPGEASYDLDNQDPDNYTYNANGQLTSDVKEGVTEITWNASGKVSKVTKANGAEITFTYDAMGQRVGKVVNPNAGNNNPDDDIYTWYVRDASGNVMSTYQRTGPNGNITQIEVPLYGSARVGMAKPGIVRNNTGTQNQILTTDVVFSRNLGAKMYEFSDHLGNVRVVLGDKKTRTAQTGAFSPEILNYSDYYPFGMERKKEGTWAGTSYRYGYNGMEKDDEVATTAVTGITGNTYTTDFRELDTRIGGRWWSPDPIVKPWESPYAGFGDNPIAFADPSGLDPANQHTQSNIHEGGSADGSTSSPTKYSQIKAVKGKIDKKTTKAEKPSPKKTNTTASVGFVALAGVGTFTAEGVGATIAGGAGLGVTTVATGGAILGIAAIGAVASMIYDATDIDATVQTNYKRDLELLTKQDPKLEEITKPPKPFIPETGNPDFIYRGGNNWSDTHLTPREKELENGLSCRTEAGIHKIEEKTIYKINVKLLELFGFQIITDKKDPTHKFIRVPNPIEMQEWIDTRAKLPLDGTENNPEAHWRTYLLRQVIKASQLPLPF